MEYSLIALYGLIGFTIAVIKVRYDPYCDELEGVIVMLIWPMFVLASILSLVKPERFK